MTVGFAPTLPLLQAAAHDTVFLQPMTPASGWFAQTVQVASGIASIALMVVLIALVPLAIGMRNWMRKMKELGDRIEKEMQPLVVRAQMVLDNVEYLTTAVRADVDRVRATVAVASDALQDAVVDTEARVREFGALLTVVQREAEGMFVSTASTLRGVRTGAAELGDALRTGATPYEGGGLDDGDYDDDAPDYREPGGQQRPRIRSRARYRIGDDDA